MAHFKNKSFAFVIAAGISIVLVSCKMQMEQGAMEEPAVTGSLTLSEAQIQLANINTEYVREGSVGRRISLTGVLKVNEQSAVTVSARVQGRIEKLFFKNTGETVRKGDKLYEFYSEDLVSAEREYFRLQSNNWNFNAQYEPSLAIEERLIVMGLTRDQIKQLGREGKVLFTVTILSPVSGKIRAVNVSEGQYVKEGQSLFELAGDNTLWAEAQVYPDEIQHLRAGMPAIAVVPAIDEVPVLCNISFINPSFETGKNVTLVRAVINNPDNRLHPGMFAILNVRVQSRYGLIIPSSAVITGSKGERVWVREESGAFSGRSVTTGIQSGDSVLVLSGLDPYDMVVTSGAYLLESELILKLGSDYMEKTESMSAEGEELEF